MKTPEGRYDSKATHGWWCNARTHPTRCKYCGDSVFFFVCNCGSKVFFESLGEPWLKHQCIEYRIAQYGPSRLEGQIRDSMMAPSDDGKMEISTEYTREIEEYLTPQFEPEIIRMEPSSMMPTAEIEGTVMEIIPEVNVFRRFRVPEDSVFAAALLQDLGKSKFSQLTVHSAPLEGTGDRESYTFFIDQDAFAQLGGVQQGDVVVGNVRPLTVLDRGVVWLNEKLNVIS